MAVDFIAEEINFWLFIRNFLTSNPAIEICAVKGILLCDNWCYLSEYNISEDLPLRPRTNNGWEYSTMSVTFSRFVVLFTRRKPASNGRIGEPKFHSVPVIVCAYRKSWVAVQKKLRSLSDDDHAKPAEDYAYEDKSDKNKRGEIPTRKVVEACGSW